MRFSTIALCALLSCPSASLAGTLAVQVVGADGKPARDVVVSLHLQGKGSPAPKLAAGYQVRQQNTKFEPFISVVPVGASVAFPNLDPFKHHVYSFSATKRFELKLFARDQTRSVIFDKPGLVAVGCNIHDSMTAFIYVTDTLWTARTDARGMASFGDVPYQPIELTVWHPYLNAPAGLLKKQLAATDANRTETVAVKFRPAPMNHMGNY